MMILKELKDSDDYMNSSSLANKLGVSTRTITRYIKSLSDILRKNGADLIISNRGYKIRIDDKYKYNAFIVKSIESYNFALKDSKIIRSILSIILTSDFISQDEISNKLYISRSSINKFINPLKNKLSKYNIALNNKPHYGYFISGAEMDIRNCMVKYLIKDIEIDDITILEDLLDFSKDSMLNLINKLSDIFKTEKLLKNNLELSYITKYVLISAFRCKRGKSIALDGNYRFMLENKVSIIAKKVAEIVKDELDVDFTIEDIFYIAYLIGNSYDEFNNIEAKDEYFNEMVISCLNEIKDKYEVNFLGDEKLIDGLKNHLYTSFFRYHLNATLGNPLISKIKSKYIQEYNYAILCKIVLEQNYKINISEDDLGYIALHFAASTERGTLKDKLNAIIVCSNGIGTAELIKSRIIKNIPNLSIVGTYPEYVLDNLNLSNINLIISTIEPINKNLGCKVIYISPLLQTEDIENIVEHISKANQYDYLEKILDEELIFFNVNANTKDEAIESATNLLLNKKMITKEAAESIKNREEISATEINELVAIPHCIVKGNEKSIIGIVVLEKPILWDKVYVQLLFLGCLHPEVKENRSVFTTLYKLTKKKSKVNSLIKCKNGDEFKKILFSEVV